MLDQISIKVVYRYRFLPLLLSVILLIVALSLKYALKVQIGSSLGWTVFLSIASFIYYRAILETKKNREVKTELEANPPAPASNEEIEIMHQNEMEEAKKTLTSNIIIRSVYLSFGILLALGGLSIVLAEDDISYFGIVILVLGILHSIYSIFVLREWVFLYQVFKKKAKENFPDKLK